MFEALPELLRARDLERARELLKGAAPQQVAQALRGVAAAEVQIALQLLDQKTAISMFELLDPGARKSAFDFAPAVPELVRQAIELLLAERQFQTLHHILGTMEPVDLARLLESLPAEAEAVAFRLLAKGVAVETFEQMDSEQQQRLLRSFTDERTRELVAAMSPDDRARLLDEVPASVAHRLTQLLPPEERRATLMLLAYEESSAGRVMTTDFVNLRAGMTVARALERIRWQALDKETIYYAYVTDGVRHLLGTVSLKDLVLADPEALVSSLMAPNPKFVSTLTDQEEVARVLRDYDLLAVPVVDGEERLVGIVTWDDVLDIVEEEATEDMYRLVGLGVEESVTSSLGRSVLQRLPWLLVNLGTVILAAVVITLFNSTIAQLVVLAAFLPVIGGQGGVAGTQTLTLVVRSIALGEVSFRSGRRVLLREVMLGGINGIILGVIIGVVGLAWGGQEGGRSIVLVLALFVAMTANMVIAGLAGAVVPLGLRAIGQDPALASVVVVTTITDVGGFSIFLGTASILLVYF